VKEIRLVKERGSKASRGFAFVEFHELAAARAAVDAPQPILIDGVAARVSFARDIKGGGISLAAAACDSVEGCSGFEAARPQQAMQRQQQQAAAHQGPKRSGFGIPSGFLPDSTTGYYFSAATGYYYDASTKLYYHPITAAWYASDPVTGQLREHSTVEGLGAATAFPAGDAVDTGLRDARPERDMAEAEADKLRAERASPTSGAAADGIAPPTPTRPGDDGGTLAQPLPLVQNHSKVRSSRRACVRQRGRDRAAAACCLRPARPQPLSVDPSH